MPRGQVRFKTARFHRLLFQQIDYQPIPFRPRANDSFSFPFLCHIAPPLSGHCLAPFAPFLHNGTVFSVLLPLWNVPFRRTIDLGLLDSIASHDSFHNGTVSRISLPLRNVPFRRTIDTGLLDSIASHDSFHNGTVSRISLPLRNVPFRRTIDTGLLDSIASHDSFHNGTVSRILLPLWNILMELPLFHSFGRSSLSVHLPDSFQRSNGNENHPEHEKRTIPSSTRSKGVAFSRNPPTP